MHCFSLGFLENLIIWLIVLCAIVACIRLLIPWLASITGMGIVGQLVQIVLWAIVAILVVAFIFDLFGCLLGAGPPFHVGRW